MRKKDTQPQTEKDLVDPVLRGTFNEEVTTQSYPLDEPFQPGRMTIEQPVYTGTNGNTQPLAAPSTYFESMSFTQPHHPTPQLLSQSGGYFGILARSIPDFSGSGHTTSHGDVLPSNTYFLD